MKENGPSDSTAQCVVMVVVFTSTHKWKFSPVKLPFQLTGFIKTLEQSILQERFQFVDLVQKSPLERRDDKHLRIPNSHQKKARLRKELRSQLSLRYITLILSQNTDLECKRFKNVMMHQFNCYSLLWLLNKYT